MYVTDCERQMSTVTLQYVLYYFDTPKINDLCSKYLKVLKIC